jgi:hypothetical protein
MFMNKQLYVTLLLLTASLQFASHAPQAQASQKVSKPIPVNNNSSQADDGRSPRQDDPETCRQAFLLAMEQQRLALEKIANNAKK